MSWSPPSQKGTRVKRTAVILTAKEDDRYNLLLSSAVESRWRISVGTSQAAKAASHDRILDIAAARIRRDGVDSLSVDDLMKEAGLTHGGFYRHFGSREQLVAEAAQRALTQGSAWTIAVARRGGRRGYASLVDGYLSARHRDHPESGCGVAGVAADVARAGGAARAQLYPSGGDMPGRAWLTSWTPPTARSENAKQSSPSVFWSARSPWREQSTTPTCHNGY